VIVLSLALLAAAAVFLVVGILRGDSGTVLLVASIVSTLAAAVLLYLGVRPRTRGSATGKAPDAGTRSAAGGDSAPRERTGAGTTRAAGAKTGAAAGGAVAAAGAGQERPAGDRVLASAPAGPDRTPGPDRTAADRTAPGRTGPGSPAGSPAGTAPVTVVRTSADVPRDGSNEEDPPDEPGIEAAQLGDLARVAGRDDEVLVVDGRPRYHVAGCAHLSGRTSEGLPVSEAAELGFTPCARCGPVATLLG
jgi:hypothetical protein